MQVFLGYDRQLPMWAVMDYSFERVTESNLRGRRHAEIFYGGA